jgi:tetratricopeptide (TPR) repeat protein
MAEVLLTQAVNQAEEAIESGNYGGAIETCQRILGQFPEFAGAHRIMGEAYAEQGELEAAREAFHRTLERDPQSIQAHLGLGMLAEDANDRETALAYFQVAWEIDPRRRDLREHVSRISQQLYGADGRLYLTRAALASLHFHAGRWDRAVTESAQVLQEYSTRVDVQVRLAEALWRRGDDEEAREVCKSILRALPSAVVPLLVLADIHRHEGDSAGAAGFLKQARDIDPDGVRAADLIMVGLDDQADFLSVDDIPVIDDQIVHEEPAWYAPAPDFSASEEDESSFADDAALMEDVEVSASVDDMPEQPETVPENVQPFRWEDVGDEDLEASDLESGELQADSPSDFSLPTDEELDQARPADQRPAGFTGMLDSLDSEGMQPFDPSGGAAQESQSTHDWDDISLPTDEELEQARPKTDDLGGHTSMLDELDFEGMQPFDPFADESPDQHEPAAPPPVEREASNESHDDSFREAEEIAGADEFANGEMTLPTDEELEQARPGDERPAGFTGMLDSLDSEGMQPFDATDSSEMLPQSRDDLMEFETTDIPGAGEPVPDVPAEEQTDEAPVDGASDLTDLGEDSPFELDWSDIDSEIEEAIPGELPRGYTDELRDLDGVGLEPFAFEEPQGADREEPSGDEPPAQDGMNELDLDQLAAGWEPKTEIPDDDPASDQEELDSIGVVFEADDLPTFSETEPLHREPHEGSPGSTDEAAGEERLWETEFASEGDWEFAEGLDDLIDGVPAAEELSAAETDDPGIAETPETLLLDDSGYDLPVGERVEQEVPARPDRTSSVVGISVSAERLGLDEALIDRARASKQSLIDAGRISGELGLPGVASSIDSLRSAVENDPLNIEHRIALASALVQEHPDDALEQFRWVYRNAPEHGVEIVKDLGRLIDVMREREVGVHRLLGALYRRHGDWLAAATHYEESLTGKHRRSAR